MRLVNSDSTRAGQCSAMTKLRAELTGLLRSLTQSAGHWVMVRFFPTVFSFSVQMRSKPSPVLSPRSLGLSLSDRNTQVTVFPSNVTPVIILGNFSIHVDDGSSTLLCQLI